MMNACERLYILHYTLYTLLHYISLYIYYTTQYTDGNNWLSCLMYSTPVALVDQRRRVFVKSPIEARGTKSFEKRESVAELPLFCRVDTSTLSLKVRSQCTSQCSCLGEKNMISIPPML